MVSPGACSPGSGGSPSTCTGWHYATILRCTLQTTQQPEGPVLVAMTKSHILQTSHQAGAEHTAVQVIMGGLCGMSMLVYSQYKASWPRVDSNNTPNPNVLLIADDPFNQGDITAWLASKLNLPNLSASNALYKKLPTKGSIC